VVLFFFLGLGGFMFGGGFFFGFGGPWRRGTSDRDWGPKQGRGPGGFPGDGMGRVRDMGPGGALLAAPLRYQVFAPGWFVS